MMNSDDLILFAQVARHGGIARTALTLGTDQSTVSRRIGMLEAELGLKLFQRTGRGVTLTDQGNQLLIYANNLVDLLAEAENVMREGVGKGPVQICIAAQPTIARVLFGRVGHALKKAYPNSRLRFIEGLASQILDRLADGDVDLAILYLPEHRNALQFELLLSEAVHFVAPASFQHNQDSFDVRQLGAVKLILPSTRHGLKILVEELAARYGFTPDIALECDGSISLTKRLVAEGHGCTVLPQAAVTESIANGTLRSFPLEPDVRRDIGIVWPKNRAKPAGFYAVTRIIREQVRETVQSGNWPDAKLHVAKEVPLAAEDADNG